MGNVEANNLTKLRLLRGEGLTLKVLMDHQVRQWVKEAGWVAGQGEERASH